MDLFEHEGKEILHNRGVMIPSGQVCIDQKGLRECMISSTFPSVVKAQVTTGGRGKAGGIKVVHDAEEGIAEGTRILSMKINGKKVQSLLVEELIPIERELYLGIVLDPSSGTPVLLVSSKGGVDVESVPPAEVLRLRIDPLIGLPEYVIRRSMRFLGLESVVGSRFSELLRNLWRTYWDLDLELLEVNPLIITPDGDLMAADVKMTVNDDSLYRQEGLGLEEDRERTVFERRTRELGLAGVELEGSVAVLANGAGLTMSVMDSLRDHGMSSGAFLDLGGSDDPAKVGEAVGLLLDRDILPHIEGIIICIFGGITRCDTVAEGLIALLAQRSFDVPLVVRLRGIREKEAVEMLNHRGLRAFREVEAACLCLRDEMGVN